MLTLTYYSQLLTAELRALSLAVHDADVWPENSSEQQQASLESALSESHKVLKDLQAYIDKLVELRKSNSVDGKDTSRSRYVERAWNGLQWESSVVDSFQTRITSIITKVNALSQGKIGQDVDTWILVQHDDQQRELSISPPGSLVPLSHDFETEARGGLEHRGSFQGV